MKKWYVFFNKSNRRYEVRKATIIGETEDSYVILEGENTIVKRKDCVFDDKNYANTVKKELVTTRTVKNRFKGKYYICPKCGKKIRRSEVTVDHKIPKAFFKKLAKEKYGVDDLRLVEETERLFNEAKEQILNKEYEKAKEGFERIFYEEIPSDAIIKMAQLGENELNINMETWCQNFIRTGKGFHMLIYQYI